MANSERRRHAWIALAAATACAAGTGGCRVDFPAEAVFTCQSDAECGGGSAICLPRPGTLGACCLPSPETCDGEDNDCDGYPDNGVGTASCYEGPEGSANVGICRPGQRYCVGGQFGGGCLLQILPQNETCNGVDDDCDGEIDEDFALQSDPFHCGACTVACGPSDQCKNGTCIPSSELLCDNNVDDDQNGLTDCADPDCNGRNCGGGCTCGNGDKHESDCGDGLSNDDDVSVDCADSDCATRLCRPAPATFTCVQADCVCNGQVSPPPEAACSDGTDDDCDGLRDCADSDCNGPTCGPGCACQGGAPHETQCDDNLDNDGDGLTDCRDNSDCPRDTPCKTGKCKANGTCG